MLYIRVPYLTSSKTVPVVWKVTPLFASWLASPTTNLFFRTGLLGPTSTVLELGCGVSALVGLAVGPLVSRYVLSDQSYVAKFVEQNLQQNTRNGQNRRRNPPPPSKSSRSNKGKSSHPPARDSSGGGGNSRSVTFHPLDWELDAPTRDLAVPDVVVACDCIYNDALIPPFVQTCVDACRLRSSGDDLDDDDAPRPPCVCVVAQQLRDPEIFEGWLREFVRKGFRVWRVPDDELAEGLRSSSGFVVHVGVLREAFE